MAFDALTTATAGLRVTQSQIGVVSQNIANVGTVGYVRRTLTPVTTGPGNAGVASGTIARAIDAAALKQLRSETSGAAYTSTLAGIRGQLDALYGRPGDGSALDGMFNGFTQSLQSLAANPTSTAARTTVVSAASGLATTIATAANGVQSLRSGLEAQLASDTNDANTLLGQLAKLNAQLGATPKTDASRPDLEDQRDQALNSLAGLMDINTVTLTDGSVSVLTGSGATLVDHGNAATLSFSSRGTLSAQALYSDDPSQSGVGTIMATLPGGGKIDLIASGAIRSGSIAAAVELRDTVLPQAQRQLDDLAAGLARSMSDRPATGTAPADGTKNALDIDLTGLTSGNAVTLTVQDGGVQRNLILMPFSGTPPASVTISGTDRLVIRLWMIVEPGCLASSRSAMRAVRVDGETAAPVSSTRKQRSASPSKASPTSAPCSSTAACRSTRLAGSIGLASWFGKDPSSSKYSGITCTAPPSREKTAGAVHPAMPLPASTTTVSGRPSTGARASRWAA